MTDFAKKLGLPADIRPYWHGEDGVPRCGQEPAPLSRGCPSYDGKRCVVLGQRPDWICEPAVEAMAKAIPGFLSQKTNSSKLPDPTRHLADILAGHFEFDVDGAWETLHRHIMDGGELPEQWRQPPCARCGQEE